jgi:ribonuclease HI
MKKTTLAVAGKCDSVSRIGAWGCILTINQRLRTELMGVEHDTTSNAVLLTGMIESLRKVNEPSTIMVFTDSTYLKGGLRKSCKTSDLPLARNDAMPIANAALWEKLGSLLAIHRIETYPIHAHMKRDAARLARAAFDRRSED